MQSKSLFSQRQCNILISIPTLTKKPFSLLGDVPTLVALRHLKIESRTVSEACWSRSNPPEWALCRRNHNMWCWNLGAGYVSSKWIRSTSITCSNHQSTVSSSVRWQYPGPRSAITIEVRTNSESSVIRWEVFNDKRGRANITKLSKCCW